MIVGKNEDVFDRAGDVHADAGLHGLALKLWFWIRRFRRP